MPAQAMVESAILSREEVKQSCFAGPKSSGAQPTPSEKAVDSQSTSVRSAVSCHL